MLYYFLIFILFYFVLLIFLPDAADLPKKIT